MHPLLIGNDMEPVDVAPTAVIGKTSLPTSVAAGDWHSGAGGVVVVLDAVVVTVTVDVGQPVDLEGLRPATQLALREIALAPRGEHAPVCKMRHFPGALHGARIIGIDLAQVKAGSGLNHCFMKAIRIALRASWPR